MTTGLPKPWCPSCDWNLDQATPVVFGWRWADRRLHRVASRLTDAQFAALAEGPLSPRTMTAARVATLAAAVLLLAAVLGIAALGVWLLFFDFFSVSTVLGALLIGIAVVLRPRLGRLSGLAEHGVVVEPAKAPHLFALVKRVATAVGAPEPRVVMLGYDLNAFTTAVGVRRTRVLNLGLPMWATLEPQERVALMALTAAIARESGIAVLFTEHDMDVVFAHADRILVLDRGALIAEGAPAAVRADPKVREVYLGSGAVTGAH